MLKAKGFAHVRGGPKDFDGTLFPATELDNRFRLDTMIVGESCPADTDGVIGCIRRCAERKEVLVLASRGISLEWLERVLAAAKECGVAVLGFDEL